MPDLFVNLPPRPPLEARARFAGRPQGAIYQVAAGALGDALARGESPDVLIRRRLRGRRELGSRDRRLLSDAAFFALRYEQPIRHLLALGGWSGEREGEALWLGALVWSVGLESADADAAMGTSGMFAALERPAEALAGVLAEGGVDPLALRTSLPEWMLARLRAERGAAAEAIALALTSQAPVTLRANARRVARDALVERLQGEGLEASPGRWSPWSIQVEGRPDVQGLSAFKEGLFELQDEGSQLIAELVQAPRRGEVIDLCAGAGGKTLALAAVAPKGARLYASDVREGALRQAQRRLSRAGVRGVEIRRSPPDGPPPFPPESASRVLVDAPCTGAGTLRRRPGLRWTLTPEVLAARAALQRQILARAAALVRPGGRAIYATCSVLRGENQAIVEGFLAERPGWSLIPVKDVLGRARAEALGGGTWLELDPAAHGTDGFFAAILARQR